MTGDVVSVMELHGRYAAEMHVIKREPSKSIVDPYAHYVSRMRRQCLIAAAEKIEDGQEYVVRFEHGRYESEGIVRLAVEVSLWREVSLA